MISAEHSSRNYGYIKENSAVLDAISMKISIGLMVLDIFTTKMRIELDDWQREFINYIGDKILVAGRQTGKSEAQAYDNGEFAANNQGTNTLLISKTQRQSEELLIKTLNYLQEYYPKRIGKGKWKPLKSTIWVMPINKKDMPARIMCLPVGLAGEGIRSYTIHKLSIDEGQIVEDAVYDAVTPMLLTTGGHISISGTPQGKRGFFWKAYENKKGLFKVFHVNSEEVIDKRKISESWPAWKREAGLIHLEREKARMTAKRYAQEYLGIFVEDLDQLFPDDLINKICVLKRNEDKSGNNFLGVDIGRVYDPSTFEILDAANRDFIKQKENIVEYGLTIPETAARVKELISKWKLKGSGIDGGGLGAGVVDILMMDLAFRGKIEDLNNSQRVIAYKDSEEKKKKLLKEQMYLNLFSLMAENKIRLLDDEDIRASLRSCQIEYIEGKDDIKVYGSDTHIAEGIIRSAWIANNKKVLKLWAA